MKHLLILLCILRITTTDGRIININMDAIIAVKDVKYMRRIDVFGRSESFLTYQAASEINYKLDKCHEKYSNRLGF